MAEFRLHTTYKPRGDQPQAIAELVKGIREGRKFQTLLGVTGSGKTYTIANVIAQVQKPTLVVSHNKTLAAQLYGEFKAFFPENAVEYFISYYDYYQPEAYLPVTDTYIEKDMSRNEEIDKLRLRATSALMAREDVIVVASVSCIYGLGDPEDYEKSLILLQKGHPYQQKKLLRRLVDIFYERNEISLERGTFRVRGDVIEIYPAYWDEVIQLSFWGEELTDILLVHPLTGEIRESVDQIAIYPARHFVTTQEKMERAIRSIEAELKERIEYFRREGRLLEAQRIEQRTRFDLEMMREVGYCSGIENYSRHITGRKPGQRPYTLIDFFPKDYLLVIDESHVTIPQFRAMYNGDLARKNNLVEYGFRLPSAKDNRPLKFEEFESLMNQVIFVSATPGPYELEKCGGVVVEQVIRPTGLMDPEIEVRPTKGQIDDLIEEIRQRVAHKERVLVTTLTKRMAEDLTDYLINYDIRVRYLHSEIDSLERVAILRDLRLGEFDVLVGINLLREGLDLPEVGLVAILDADKEGFLRSETSLLQIAGRAARNVNGKVLLYADRITDSMRKVIEITRYRRQKQADYNTRMGITPKTIYKTTEEIMGTTAVADVLGNQREQATRQIRERFREEYDGYELLELLRKDMLEAAERQEYEKAALLRDEIKKLEKEIKRSGL